MELRDYIREKAEHTVEQLQEGSSVPLDYSPESLAGIEQILSEISQHLNEIPDDQVNAFVNLMGGYIHEVAAQEFDGHFLWYAERDQPIFITGEPEYHVAIITLDKVRGRIRGDEADHIPFFYEGFQERARQAKKGDRALYV